VASCARQLWLPFEVDLFSFGPGLLLLECILLDTAQEIVPALGVLDVLDADVNALLEVAVANTLVNDYTDGGFCYVVNDTCTAVVELVGHTLLDSTVDFYINDIANLVCLEVSRKPDRSLVAELAGEHVPRTGTDTVRVRHASIILSIEPTGKTIAVLNPHRFGCKFARGGCFALS